MDRISIALAVYNGERYLPQQLASLQAQTITPHELIVLDDCSTDKSLEVINAFPLSFEKKIFLNEKNRGPNSSFKKLAGLCSGNYIAFCDQDDIWLPDKIESSLLKMKEIDNNKPTIVFSDLSVIDEDNKPVHDSFWKLRLTRPENFSLKDILFGNIVTGCASLINNAMANELAKMPVNVIMYDYWMALIGYSFGRYSFINKPLVLYRAHDLNVTDKQQASFIKNFINELKNKPAYLHKNIQQAIEFKNLYAGELNRKDLKILNNFIALKKQPFFYKRFVRDKTSLLRRLK
ncbi:glycosyltransferase family 2 protein [Parafilimonas sp.]|uniref:glycosyltransferase family 2 protein n=1 Tax=Parafilimonas sp. TaxID=1969739 RepID=UPI0039E48EE6